MWYIHTVGYHSTLKKGSSDIGYNVMSLENIILSEISQRKKDKYIIHLYEVTSIGKFIKNRKEIGGYQGPEGKKGVFA